jgi:PEGA domain
MIISGKNRFLTAQCLAVGVALVGFALYAPRMLAQAVAEAAATTSATAGVAANAKPTESFKPISAAATQGPAPSAQVSLHILSSTKTVSVDANRRALESRAGAAAARLMVRATPSQAQVWINNEPVGSTPLLLILAPGKYAVDVEMHGSRQEIARQDVALLPKENREVNVKLAVRYPTRVVATH